MSGYGYDRRDDGGRGGKRGDDRIRQPTRLEQRRSQRLTGQQFFDRVTSEDEKTSIDLLEQRILMGEASEPLTGVGLFLGLDDPDYEFRAGDPDNDFIHWDGSDLSITGQITATTGTIGGWTIGSDELSNGNVKIQSDAERILFGAATAPLTGVGVFLGLDVADYEFRVGDPAGNYIHWDGSAFTIVGQLIGTANLVDGAATEAKIGTDAVTTAKIDALAVTASELASDAVTNAKIASGAVDSAELATDAVTNAKIAALAVDSAELADDAVTTAKLLNAAVTEGKLDTGAVTTTKLGSAAVTEAKLGTGSVTEAKIGGSAVTTAKLASGAVTTAKIGASAVTTTELDNGSVTEAKIGSSAVTTVKVDTGAITEAKIGSAAVTTAKLASGSVTQVKVGSGLFIPEIVSALPTLPDASYPDGSTVVLNTDWKLYRNASGTWTVEVETTDLSGQITTTQITDSAVTTAKVNAGAITAAKIAAGTITANEIAADTILAGNIAAGAIGTDEIAADAVVAAKIAAGTITASEIASGTITATEIASGTITATEIAAGTITASEIAANTITVSELDAGVLVVENLTGTNVEIDTLRFGHSDSPSDDDFRYEIDSSANNNLTRVSEFYDSAEGSWYTGGFQEIITKTSVVANFLEDTGGGNATVHALWNIDKDEIQFKHPVDFQAGVSGAGGMVPLATITASTDATVDITTGIDSTYDEYIVFFEHILPATDAVHFYVRTSPSGTSAWDTGASDYAYAARSDDNVFDGTSDFIRITNDDVRNVNGDVGVCGHLHLVRPSSSGEYTLVHGRVGHDAGNSGFENPAECTFTGYRKSLGDVDAIRFYFSSGNITSGIFHFYGVVKPT